MNSPERIITIFITITRKAFFWFRDSENVLRPYSVTRCIGITENYTKNGIKNSKKRFSGTTDKINDIKSIELKIKIQFALVYCDF